MSERPTTVTSDAPLDEVTTIMAEGKYGSVVVMGHGSIEGIFTTVDACRALAELLEELRNAEIFAR
jgi:acetoin utilization protein AcuB